MGMCRSTYTDRPVRCDVCGAALQGACLLTLLTPLGRKRSPLAESLRLFQSPAGPRGDTKAGSKASPGSSKCKVHLGMFSSPSKSSIPCFVPCPAQEAAAGLYIAMFMQGLARSSQQTHSTHVRGVCKRLLYTSHAPSFQHRGSIHAFQAQSAPNCCGFTQCWAHRHGKAEMQCPRLEH